jgi:hypothetical protein
MILHCTPVFESFSLGQERGRQVLSEWYQAFAEVNLRVTASEACSAVWILGTIWFSIMLRVAEFGRSYDVLNAYRL